MRTYSELRAVARQSLRGKWGRCAGLTILRFLPLFFLCITTFLCYKLCSLLLDTTDATDILWYRGFLITLVVFTIAGIVVLFAVDYVYCGLFLRLARTNSFGRLKPNRRRFGRIFITMLRMNTLKLLWGLLWIIPGIVKGYSYAMTLYILRDYPELGPRGATLKSKLMMRGHKRELFLLNLSFIGWIALGIITCGIGLLFVYPYMRAAHAHFYNDVKAEYERQHAEETEVIEQILKSGTIMIEDFVISVLYFFAICEILFILLFLYGLSEPVPVPTYVDYQGGDVTFNGDTTIIIHPHEEFMDTEYMYIEQDTINGNN